MRSDASASAPYEKTWSAESHINACEVDGAYMRNRTNKISMMSKDQVKGSCVQGGCATIPICVGRSEQTELYLDRRKREEKIQSALTSQETSEETLKPTNAITTAMRVVMRHAT